MQDPNRKVIALLWTVIASLVIGGIIAGFLIVRKADEMNRTNAELTSDNDNLRRSLLEAQQKPSPSPSPTPSASPSPTATPSPTASPAP